MKIKEAILRSLRNIISYGDTDIFPFPFERYLFDDKFSDCAAHVADIDKCFDSHLASHPPLTIDTLTQIEYTGFRRATQIEPFWNATRGCDSFQTHAAAPTRNTREMGEDRWASCIKRDGLGR